MKIWFERALAGIRWVWGHIAHGSKMIFAKLRVWLSVIVDPPARTRLFYLLVGAALISLGWTSYAFVNSWFYKPTIQALAEFSYVLSGDDGDVVLPEPAPSPTRVEIGPPLAVTALPKRVCHDMSDTPHCTAVEQVKAVEVVSVLPPPVAKPKLDTKKKNRIYRKVRKHQPFQTYWGF